MQKNALTKDESRIENVTLKNRTDLKMDKIIDKEEGGIETGSMYVQYVQGI